MKKFKIFKIFSVLYQSNINDTKITKSILKKLNHHYIIIILIIKYCISMFSTKTTTTTKVLSLT